MKPVGAKTIAFSVEVSGVSTVGVVAQISTACIISLEESSFELLRRLASTVVLMILKQLSSFKLFTEADGSTFSPKLPEITLLDFGKTVSKLLDSQKALEDVPIPDDF